ncbi:MAG: hypothetical protein Q8N91_05335 [Candidatus Omnitrophota bacterium]|nr:hypothetical protein [Candidatus Omnitrophota bacterium]
MEKLLLIAVIFAASIFTPALSAEEKKAGEEVIMPKKVSTDSNYDGKVDRTEVYDTTGNIKKTELDRNADGKTDEWVTYDKGRPAKTERDTNGDGLPDVWIEY